MTQSESCVYLIRELLQEAPRYSSLSIPNSAEEKSCCVPFSIFACPIIYGRLTQKDQALLASCFSPCLALADEHNIDSIAFCCISMG